MSSDCTKSVLTNTDTYSFCLSLKICNLFGLSVIKIAYHIDNNSKLKSRDRETETRQGNKNNLIETNKAAQSIHTLLIQIEEKIKSKNEKQKNLQIN